MYAKQTADAAWRCCRLTAGAICPNNSPLLPRRLAELKANVIITQDQCRVCAVSEPQLREAVEAWAASCQVRTLSIRHLTTASCNVKRFSRGAVKLDCSQLSC